MDLISLYIKTISKSYKNKDYEYKRDRQRKRNKRNVYTIHGTQIHTNKYIKHVTSKPTTLGIREKWIDKYANAQTTIYAECTSNNVAVIELSRSENMNLIFQE